MQRDNLLELELQLPARIQNLLLDTDAMDPSIQGFSRLLWPRTPLNQVILPAATVQEVMALVGQVPGGQVSLHGRVERLVEPLCLGLVTGGKALHEDVGHGRSVSAGPRAVLPILTGP